MTARLEQALSGITFENLDISDEVKEQVETEDLHIMVIFFLFSVFHTSRLWCIILRLFA